MAKDVTKTWPAAKVEMWELDRIIPYPGNPRQHSPEQVDLIARSMLDDGVTAPILVDEDGIIIYGHGRRMGAEKNAFKVYPVVVARGWSEEKKKAYRIKDNSYALLSTWSDELLRVELKGLSAAGYEMNLLGFDDVQLVSFMSVPSGADPEVVPPTPVTPTSRAGDVWQLGKHRILCGDSTKADDVELVLDGKKPNLMVTDPPYGVDYNPAWRHTAKRSTGERLSTGNHSMGKVSNDDRSDWSAAWKLFDGDVAYVWHSGLHGSSVQVSLESAGFEVRSQIIWNKNVMIISRGHYHFKHEPCWYAVRRGAPNSRWSGDRKQTSVWDIPIVHATAGDANDGKNVHGTQKPVECMRRPIQNNSRPGDHIYEPFAGSGTTIIAAEMMNRYCLAVELNPEYVDVCVLRWQEFAKGEAVLAGDGRTYEQVAKARKAKGRSSKTAKPKPRANAKGAAR